jgi:hypothetical protein
VRHSRPAARPRTRLPLLPGTSLAALLLAGCGGTPVLERADLERDVAQTLAGQVGTEPEVSCPGDLTGSVDESVRCEVTLDGDQVPVEVVVTEVDGADIAYEVAPTLLSTSVEEEVSARLAEQVGVAPDDVSCPADLVGRVGEELRCVLTAGTDELGVTVTVTEVDGAEVEFDVQVDEEIS